MSVELTTHHVGHIETHHERAIRRTRQLHNAFQSVFEVLAEIYRDEDWRYVNDAASHPYTGFTAFVQDQLGCAASNARRYQQGIVGLILPLQELATPGARIPVTSSDVARLGVTGSRVVVESAPAALDGVNDPAEQTEALRDLIDSVTKRSTEPGFGPIRESTTPAPSLGSLVPVDIPDPENGNTWPTTSTDHAPTAEPPPLGQPQSQGTPPAQHDGNDTPNPATSPPAPTRPDQPAIQPTQQPATSTDRDITALEVAIDAILNTGDPATLAERLHNSNATTLASKCLTSGQRLVRLGQLLRTLG